MQCKTTPINHPPKILDQLEDCECAQLAGAETFLSEANIIVTVRNDTLLLVENWVTKISITLIPFCFAVVNNETI